MATITLNISGDEQPASVSLRTLTRSDTGDTVADVTLPGDFTSDGSGGWTFDFTEPVAGLHYDYTFRMTWDDGTFNEASGSLDMASGASPEGTYGDWLGIKEQLGVTLANASSDLENTQLPEAATADLTRVAVDIATADAYTEHRATNGTKPRDVDDLATADDFLLIRLATNLYAAYLLVAHKVWALPITPSEQDSAMAGLYGRAMKMYEELFGPINKYPADADGIEVGTLQNVPITFLGRCDVGDEFASDG